MTCHLNRDVKWLVTVMQKKTLEKVVNLTCIFLCIFICCWPFPNHSSATQIEFFFWILLIQTEIRLYISFSDWFGTKRNSLWFQINRKMLSTIWFRLHSTKLREYLPVHAPTMFWWEGAKCAILQNLPGFWESRIALSYQEFWEFQWHILWRHHVVPTGLSLARDLWRHVVLWPLIG